MNAEPLVPSTVEPDVSLIMPCYNEEDNVGYTIPKLVEAFDQAGYVLQLVAVNNGSRDRTGEALANLAQRYRQVTCVTVDQNIGFGKGVLSGIPHCTAPWVGMVAADGQVDAEDIVRLYEAASSSRSRVLAKVRRRFRMDGLARKFISVGYNTFVRLLWPALGSWDVNGNPRVLPRDVLLAMRLESTNWFLDPEMLIKAHYMGVRVLELNVFARMRGNGLSHVRASTCWEFFRMLLRYRVRSRPEWLKMPEGEMPAARDRSRPGRSPSERLTA
jgi:glycosyltransferase involved in cell wall biosynthesis